MGGISFFGQKVVEKLGNSDFPKNRSFFVFFGFYIFFWIFRGNRWLGVVWGRLRRCIWGVRGQISGRDFGSWPDPGQDLPGSGKIWSGSGQNLAGSG